MNLSLVSNNVKFTDIWKTTEYPLYPEGAKHTVWPIPVFNHAYDTIDGVSRVSKRV